jgi:putative ABC transport system substrate-binding protein
MALLVNPTNPVLAQSTAKELQDAARTLGLRLHILQAGSERDFDSVFATLNQLRVSGLVIAIDSFFTGRREELGALALRHGIAAIYQYRDFAAAGGVISYGGSGTEPYRLVGVYTGRILKGEKPADLTRVELVINMKTAKALGLAVPSKLLALADELID